LAIIVCVTGMDSKTLGAILRAGRIKIATRCTDAVSIESCNVHITKEPDPKGLAITVRTYGDLLALAY